MSWYLRKAFQIGQFLRLNLSKSGLGYSVGVKGARLGSGPSGDYVHLGRHGLYYRENLSSGADNSQKQPPSQMQNRFVPSNEAVARQLHAAQSEFLKGQWGHAIEIYNQLIADATTATIPATLFDCYLDRGLALREVGRIEEALRDYEAAGKIIPTDWRPHNNAGLIYHARYVQYLGKGDFDASAAMTDYQRAMDEYDAG
jgi:tetratricopeptide (TPR) repeat protein